MSESSDENQPKTLDQAITACEKIIFWHRLFAIVTLALVVGVAFSFYGAFELLELQRRKIVGIGDLSGVVNVDSITDFIHKTTLYPYLIAALFLAVFGILIALYRFHMAEIARNEQMKLGFWRIRIAARNTTMGFQTEVRQSLTKDAFNFSLKGQKEKGKEMESPVQGHPASDFATAILNKILDNVDVSVAKKDK
jgi:predicted membrane protein